MIITLERSGGFAAFAALSKPIVVDTSRLPEPDASEFERLVADAALDRRPTAIPPPDGAADFRSLLLRVESPGQTRTLRFTDAVQDDALSALVRRVEEHVGGI